jgi:hypothetical protein
MQQLNNPIDPPEMPSFAFSEPIPEERAAVLASGAMEFSHKLLAVVHKEDEREIKVTFAKWFKEEGRKVLSMDPKNASEFKAKSNDEEEGSDFEAMPPAKQLCSLWHLPICFNSFQYVPTRSKPTCSKLTKGSVFSGPKVF